ncbi:MAG: LysM peptidoglycan-binding domain-containing protein [Eubacterium sp.]|nr:LysM peptidoglycan-binding domain-containing protein [Eubacterium sp.]
MNKRYIKKAFFLFLLPMFVLACCISASQLSEAQITGDRTDDVVAYESVLICRGDTLWTIAEANMDQPTEAEIREFVKEIAELNNISPAHIHAGNYLLIPRYKV